MSDHDYAPAALPEPDLEAGGAPTSPLSDAPAEEPRGGAAGEVSVAVSNRQFEVFLSGEGRPSGLSFRCLRFANVRRCEAVFHRLDDWSPTDWMTAVAGEVGEAANLIKKLRRGEAIPVEEIGKELADAVIYLDLLAARLGISLAEAVAKKFDEVSDRRGWDGERLS